MSETLESVAIDVDHKELAEQLLAQAKEQGVELVCGSPEIVEGFLCRFRLGLGFPDLVVDG